MKIPSLSTTLKGNATFSFLSAGVLGLFAETIAAFMGSFPPWIFHLLAVGLVPFGAAAVWVSRSPSAVAGRCFFAADVAWLIATPIVMLVAGPWLNLWGHLVLLDIAILVGVFAWLEWHGTRALATQQL
ncbi:hypothetical protein ACMDCT_15855 [Halomonadaceae bacterium KBTZ08]